MRQIAITAPKGSAQEVAQIAFAVGISEVTLGEKRILDASGSETTKDSIEMDVGTPLAKAFIDEFTSAPFSTREKFSIAARQPRALVCRERLSTFARPLVEPSVDIFEELWQFSQVTYGFVGRILVGGSSCERRRARVQKVGLILAIWKCRQCISHLVSN